MSVFLWKRDTPIMIVSYCSKKGKNGLIITTDHEDPNIWTKAIKEKKHMVIKLYISQHYGVHVINGVLKDYSAQPISNSQAVIVFKFILYLAASNSQTILKYNSAQHKNQPRHEFIRNLCFQLYFPHIKKRRQISLLQKNAKDLIDSVFNYIEVDREDQKEVDIEIEESGKTSMPRKCHVCLKFLTGLLNLEIITKKRNLNKIKTFSVLCKVYHLSYRVALK